MKKLKPPRLVTVAVFTTITIVFWVFYGLYGILTSDSFQKVPPEILAPIDPTLDTEILDVLPNRIFFKEGEVEVFKIPLESEPVEIQIPTPTETPEVDESTASATPTLPLVAPISVE